MKDLLYLSALFGWPVAVFALYRLSTFNRCTSGWMRWGYAMVLCGALLQATSVLALGYKSAGLLLAARALILGLMVLSAGLGLLVAAYRNPMRCAADGTHASS